MLHWLLLLVCAYASTSFGYVNFTVGQKFQIVLESIPIVTNTSKVIPLDAVVWDIDAFDSNPSIIDALKAQGKTVICYFSAGTYENWRPDYQEFTAADKGASLAPQWPDEYWLNIRSANVRKIMTQRIGMAASKGCDAVDPDNVDAYDNTNGLNLTTVDSIEYVTFLATTARTYNLSIGLKNAQTILPEVMSLVQFAVNEQCVQYGQCDSYFEFIATGKPVYHIEYPNSAPVSVSTTERNADCNPAGITGLSTVMKNMTLGGWVAYCDGSYDTTPTVNGDGNGGSKPPGGPARPSTTRRTTSRPTSTHSTSRTSTLRTSTTHRPTTNRPPATSSRTTSTHSSSAPSRTSSFQFPFPGPSRTSSSAAASSTSTGNGCKSKHYDQCGGQNWNGCTQCDTGYTCKAISPPYYYQCL